MLSQIKIAIMPYKERPIEKTHFKIGDVATELGIEPSTIRFWESELKINTKRNRKHERDYSINSKGKIEMIYQLRSLGLTIDGTRDFLKNPYDFIEKLQQLIPESKRKFDDAV